MIAYQLVFPKLLRGQTLAVLFMMIGSMAARADTSTAPLQRSQLTPHDIQTIGIDQRLGKQIPPGLRFTDSNGTAVDFDALVARKPAVLALVYYNCPNLCTLVLNGLVLSMADLRRNVGDGFQVIVVSIDPNETPALAAEKKATYLRRYARSAVTSPDWHFLIGDQTNITELAAAVGYRYRYDPILHQFAHGSGIMVIDPQRRLTKYFFGIEYPPAELDRALALARQGEVGSPVQNFLFLCYCYNPITGPYGWLIFTILKIGAAATVLGLAGYIVFHVRRDHQPRITP